MGNSGHANDAPIVFEHDWVKELQALATKAGEKDIYVEYSFPFGRLYAIGFQLRVNERTIQIPLRQQGLSDSTNLFVKFHLPDEDSAFYRTDVSADGEIFLSVSYPYCGHGWRPNEIRAEIRIATNLEFLGFVAGGAPKQ